MEVGNRLAVDRVVQVQQSRTATTRDCTYLTCDTHAATQYQVPILSCDHGQPPSDGSLDVWVSVEGGNSGEGTCEDLGLCLWKAGPRVEYFYFVMSGVNHI